MMRFAQCGAITARYDWSADRVWFVNLCIGVENRNLWRVRREGEPLFCHFIDMFSIRYSALMSFLTLWEVFDTMGDDSGL